MDHQTSTGARPIIGWAALLAQAATARRAAMASTEPACRRAWLDHARGAVRAAAVRPSPLDTLADHEAAGQLYALLGL